MNSDIYFHQQQKPQQNQPAMSHQQQYQQPPSCVALDRPSATSHRTNPYTYYAVTGGGSNSQNFSCRSSTEAQSFSGRPSTEASSNTAPGSGIEPTRQDSVRSGAGCEGSGEPGSLPHTGTGSGSRCDTRTGYSNNNIGYLPQRQQLDYNQQLEQQQQLEQHRWYQDRFLPHPPEGYWMANNSERTVNTSGHFPDSPPDSSSEPYSPPNESRAQTEVSAANSRGVNTICGMTTAIPLGIYMDPHAHQQGQHSHHQGQPTQIHPAHMHGHCGPGQTLGVTSPPHQQVTLHPSVVAYNMTKAAYHPYAGLEGAKLPHGGTQPGAPMLRQGHPCIPLGGIGNLANHVPKKRKYSDSPPGTLNPANLMSSLHFTNILPIKPEPCPPDLHYGMPHDGGSEDESYYDYPGESGMFLDGTYQVIKWTAHQQTKWVTLLDDHCLEIPAISYRVDADKGFNFSPSDDAFVCQKKNHFQVTVHITTETVPKFVKIPDGNPVPIDALYLHFYGVKMESQSQTIKIEQSQSDRSKKQFHAVRIEPVPNQLNKLTVGRLHFSETTTNNMRKKGKPNPDQRYFQLVVALQAHCGSDTHMIMAHASERIIVRASNPGQFESDTEVIWNKGKTSDSIFHAGRVGINTDSPDEALTVHGNIKVSGHIVSPSDVRAKKGIEELDTRQQLENISKLKVYRYRFKEEFAEYAGLSDEDQEETGMLAQDVYHVLPDAVRDTGEVILPNGQHIDNFLVVNKDRIFIENVGAVKELCKVTDKLETRINEIEHINSRLARLRKKCGSFISTTSSFTASIGNSISRAGSHSSALSVPSPSDHGLGGNGGGNGGNSAHRHRHHRCTGGRCGAGRGDCQASASMLGHSTGGSNSSWESKLCSNRAIQLTIIILVVTMFICLMSMTTLYLIDRKTGMSESSAQLANTPAPNTTAKYPHPLIPAHCLLRPQDCPIICTCNPSSSTLHPTPPDDPDHPRVPSSTTTESNHIPSYPWDDDINNTKNKTAKDDNRTKNKTKPVRNNTVLFEYNEGDPANVVLSANMYSKRVKRETNLKKQIAKVIFKQINDTVSRLYCVNPGCQTDSGGNYSYSIPVSPMFPRLFLTLKYMLLVENPALVISLCKQTTELSCSSDSNYNFNATQLNSLEWDIPVGYFIRSFYKFRVAELTNGLCEKPDSEVGESFVEYNLDFYRVCVY